MIFCSTRRFARCKFAKDFVIYGKNGLGGYGSGRTGWKGKVESCRSLDVNRLKKAGCLQPGYRGGWEWRADREQVASVGLRANASQLILLYKVRIDGGDWADVEEAVPLTRSPCRFGGWRFYFVCPGGTNGRPCSRRVTKIYLGGRHFLCRHCYDLAYASQSEAPYHRLQRRADKRKAALGGGPGTSVPPKPKGMHRRTYARYLAEIDAAEEQVDLGFVMGFRPRK
jgi:hypothetical protein